MPADRASPLGVTHESTAKFCSPSARQTDSVVTGAAMEKNIVFARNIVRRHMRLLRLSDGIPMVQTMNMPDVRIRSGTDIGRRLDILIFNTASYFRNG